jgi:hypothetical protein
MDQVIEAREPGIPVYLDLGPLAAKKSIKRKEIIGIL